MTGAGDYAYVADFDAGLLILQYTGPRNPPEADFSASPTSGLPPLTVEFTNLSTGGFDQCLWEFGDGRTRATCADPTLKFREEGQFTVSLTVKGPLGEDTKTVENYITTTPHRAFLPGVMVTR